jgi:hypothetical protein
MAAVTSIAVKTSAKRTLSVVSGGHGRITVVART